jgi:Uma2 family endonuclease
MTFTSADRTYRADELLALSQSGHYQHQRIELSEGRLIVMSPASMKHGIIAHRFGVRIGVFVESHPIGYVTAAETGYVLHTSPDGRDTVRAPDVGFILAERLPDGVPETGFVPVPPDLAVEIISPSDAAPDVQRKVRDYVRAGTPLIWLVYPDSRTVSVIKQREMRLLEANDTLDGGDVLPGLTIPLSPIWR